MQIGLQNKVNQASSMVQGEASAVSLENSDAVAPSMRRWNRVSDAVDLGVVKFSRCVFVATLV